MSSRKFKTPSSERRHIKLEKFSQVVSAARLRHVQSILWSGKAGIPTVDGILCIAGIDSHYNEGMYCLLDYLLFGFFDTRRDEIESSGFAEEVIDDLMILVCSDHAEVYCNPVNYHYLLPYVSHWPALKFHCLIDSEYDGEDDDVSEEFKIRSFINMTSSCHVVGIPYSGAGQKTEFDVMALEKWPIIQAYALDDFGGKGFFTMAHEVVDVSKEIHQLFNHMDSVSVELLITEQLPLVTRQWDNMIKVVQLELESSSSVISHEKVSEHLWSYFAHGMVRHRGRMSSMMEMSPFVAFGPDTERLKLQKALQGRKAEFSDLSLKTEGMNHMICQVVSPHHLLTCTRTYFFCSQPLCAQAGVSGHSSQQSDVSIELSYSVSIYFSMVKAVLKAIEVYAQTASPAKAKVKCMEVLQSRLAGLGGTSFAEYLSNSSSVDFALDVLANDARKKPLMEQESNLLLKNAKLTLYDITIQVSPGNIKCLGSMIFSETFLDSRICSSGSSEVSSEYLILTSGIPRHHLWSMSGHDKKQSGQVPKLQANQWGMSLMTQRDVHMIGVWSALLPPEKVILSVWEHGLYIQSSDYGCFSLHGSDVSSISLYDGDSMSQIAILLVEVRITDVQTCNLPPHLCTKHNDSGTVQIVFAFSPHSKAYSHLYRNVLPMWKYGSQFPSVKRLQVIDSHLETIHSYLQKKLNLSVSNTTGLQKAECEMPHLTSFLDHLDKSCGLHGPVIPEVFHSLTASTVTQKEQADEKDLQITVTIITGMPDSGKDQLASTLTSYNKNIINWLVHKQSEECQVDLSLLHQSMTAAAQARDQYLLTKSSRFIIVSPGFCDTAEIVRAMCSHPDHKLRAEFVVGAVTMCIDPQNTFMDHRMTLPMLTSNCAQGWVNNILFTSQTEAPSNLLDDVQTLIRGINTDVAFLKAEGGIVKRSSDIDLVMSETAFNEQKMIISRELIKPYWHEGYPHARPCDPVMKDVLLYFTQPLEKSLAVTRLHSIKSSLKSYPYCGNIYFVHGSLTFTGSPKFMDLQYTALTGKLVIYETKKLSSSSGEGTTNFMCFTGVDLKDNDVKQFLSSCVKQKPEKKQLCARKDLTNAEIEKIHETHHLDALPEGWYYNGSQYVSMEGERSHKHPYLENFIQSYLDKRNAEIEQYNVKIDSELYISLWK